MDVCSPEANALSRLEVLLKVEKMTPEEAALQLRDEDFGIASAQFAFADCGIQTTMSCDVRTKVYYLSFGSEDEILWAKQPFATIT